ncbi:branched-chain amino acid transport system II carrier protein [Sansalvadorimonas sp. 2012CJ34-2]|uniref:Branched-chain amino acid transport system carrier protein n=1 Tax=Parendozoicomonas callyspongiae TaxID=2942213 RepID=A0ABT0PIM5_9GAMM|nr:branched-chain amino acid transport system II carrier protein [Sansalvadorimonas sp. 2012CJ34-2]MCL6271178.1 branched-chain amino acid transport system II carrier protein [Sansalvadorimonas sp. 2012CJ34-2]
MSASLKTNDIIAIGLMTFALFLGAGNMIFPPYLGQIAGADIIIAVAGFLLTGVGLPLLGVIAAARLGGGLSKFTRDLPPSVALIVGLVLYLAIGPLFAAPRTGIVAWEMSFADRFESSSYGQTIYSCVFFGLTLCLSLFPGRLIDNIGKIITPILVLVLGAIAFGVFVTPLGPVSEKITVLEDGAFSWGFQQGYQTMDTLASLAFGIVIITALKQRGVTDSSELTRHTITAGVMAAVGLGAVYIMLSVLGATSHGVIPGAENGADILNVYVDLLYGSWGSFLLGASITLACLTTSVGLMTACAEYFSESLPIMGYCGYVIACTLVSALIANVGLNELLAITIPALLIIYPVTIALILLALVRNMLPSPARTYRITLSVIFIISFIDGLSASGVSWATFVSEGAFYILPLYSYSLGWLIPGLAAFLLSILWKPVNSTTVSTSA